VVSETFGLAVRRLRRERGVSLRQLSRMAPIDLGYLSKIENGKRPGTTGVARAVDNALKADGELVKILEAERAAQVRATVPFNPMRRRALIAWSMTAPLVAGLDLDVTGSAGQHVGRVGMTDVDRLRRATVRLHRLDQQHGGDSLWLAAVALVSDGYRMLEHGSYSGEVGTQLVKATGRAQVCAGWLAFDAGNQDVARACYTEALALGQQADDAQVETRALANLAFQSNVLGRPREALRFAGAADRVAVAPGESPRLPAVPQLRRAIAAALTGDGSTSGNAIARARTALDRDDTEAEEWNAFLTAAEVDAVEATCAILLGRPRRAVGLLDSVVGEHADRHARNRALYRVRLARARLDLTLPDGAAEAASAALDEFAGEVASWRVAHELDAVAVGLRPYAGEHGVRAFLDRYDAAGLA
jgi:transcriptional regulator with XRE-family HTH domain